jgi:hypothetical protein
MTGWSPRLALKPPRRAMDANPRSPRVQNSTKKPAAAQEGSPTAGLHLLVVDLPDCVRYYPVSSALSIRTGAVTCTSSTCGPSGMLWPAGSRTS